MWLVAVSSLGFSGPGWGHCLGVLGLSSFCLACLAKGGQASSVVCGAGAACSLVLLRPVFGCSCPCPGVVTAWQSLLVLGMRRVLSLP